MDRGATDRFNSNEETEWHPEAMSQGRMARLNGYRITSQNPYERGSFMWKSFNAGWADADMDPDAPKESLRNEHPNNTNDG